MSTFGNCYHIVDEEIIRIKEKIFKCFKDTYFGRVGIRPFVLMAWIVELTALYQNNTFLKVLGLLLAIEGLVVDTVETIKSTFVKNANGVIVRNNGIKFKILLFSTALAAIQLMTATLEILNYPRGVASSVASFVASTLGIICSILYSHVCVGEETTEVDINNKGKEETIQVDIEKYFESLLANIVPSSQNYGSLRGRWKSA